MDIGLLVPIIAVSIPIVVVASRTLRRWIDFKERELEHMSGQVAEKAAQYAAQTERLEQRVRVLERIITDRGPDLAREIDRLRDEPLN
jgi:hypothetical protein